MEINSANIEAIVRQVLASVNGEKPTADTPATKGIPATSKVAMLTGLEHFDIKEYPIPELGDDDILVKV